MYGIGQSFFFLQKEFTLGSKAGKLVIKHFFYKLVALPVQSVNKKQVFKAASYNSASLDN